MTLHIDTAVQPDPPASVAPSVVVSVFAAVTTQIEGLISDYLVIYHREYPTAVETTALNTEWKTQLDYKGSSRGAGSAKERETYCGHM